MKLTPDATVFVLAIGFVISPCMAQAASCESLAALKVPHTSITLAANVAAGAFVAPAGFQPGTRSYADLPAFCRVVGSIKPSADSDIGFEVWMPPNWNGRFMGVGNGGQAGEIFYWQMSEPLKRGYAVAASDTGHR